MDNPKPLFLVGNKRSGTSILVNALNCHPHVFITHESDIVWLLYQLAAATSATLQPYRWDGPLGLSATVGACRELLLTHIRAAGGVEPRSLYFAAQRHLMTCGSAVQRPGVKRGLLWLGDKKPVQHCDPCIRPFLRQCFPDARYLHIVRHPAAVIESMRAAAGSWRAGVPRYWHGSSDELLNRWIAHEQWVLDAQRVDGLTMHSLRFEDMCRDPSTVFRSLLTFLELDPSPACLEHIVSVIDRGANDKYATARLASPGGAALILRHYGYSKFPTSGHAVHKTPAATH